ncbi:MAG: replicative DNA helicase [Bacilli bacterium]|nr:replicative DNA helicase [Bacilli bacterium]
MAKIKLPSNVEAERAVLGAILLNPDLVLGTLSSLSENDFSGDDPRNVLVFKAMKELDAHNHPIDVESIVDQLINLKTFNDAGGSEYIFELVNSPVNFENVDHYVGMLRNQGVFREYLSKLEEIQKDYMDGKVSDISEFMSVNTQELSEIASKRQIASFQNAKTVTDDTRERILRESRRGNQNGITGIDTGFTSLNSYTHGWQPGNLIILAARPGMGKTALMLNFAYNAAKSTNRTVAIFSCEMANDLIMKRMVASQALVDIQRLQTGQLDNREMSKVEAALGDIAKTKIYFDDTPNQALGDIVSKAHKLKNDNPDLCMILIDYINIIDAQAKYDSRTLEIGVITKTLKQLSRTLNVPVMALAQVSRDADKNENHTPSLANLKESGSIEQDADLVLLLYRSNYYKNQGLDTKEKNSQYAENLKQQTEAENATKGTKDQIEVVDLNVAKNRNGQQGKINLMFTGKFQRFDNAQRPEDNQGGFKRQAQPQQQGVNKIDILE